MTYITTTNEYGETVIVVNVNGVSKDTTLPSKGEDGERLLIALNNEGEIEIYRVQMGDSQFITLL